MKKNFWLILGTTFSTAVWADQSTPSPAMAVTNAPKEMHSDHAAPASTTPAPRRSGARRTAARSAASRPATVELRTVPLVPGPAVVNVGIGPVNVRGRAGLAGEVIARLTNGEPVTVIEEVELKNSKADEPSAWAKIVLPGKARAWVKTSYIDPTTHTVNAKTKLNLRGGPGENYSVLGTLQPGETVKELQNKNGWTEIEGTAGAYAFMAAQYLKQGPELAMSTPEPAPTPTPVIETPTVTPATNDLATPAPAVAPEPTTVTPAEPTVTQPVEEPLPTRVVQREGLVRGTVSIQAPTKYELISPDTRRPINYLYTSSTNLDLSRYKGLHIIVTGEEGLDERWRNTPILTIQRIQVLE